MGQIINTNGFLLSVNKNWLCKWYSEYNYFSLTKEDSLIQKYVHEMIRKLNLYKGKCILIRNEFTIKLFLRVYYRRRIPKIIRKKKNGQPFLLRNHEKNLVPLKYLKQLKKTLQKITKKKIEINIKKTKIFDAAMLCQYIGRKIQQRVAPTSIFAKVMTTVPQRNPNIIGMRLQCNGRPTGNTIASSKWVQHGKIPIHSYKYKTDYSFQSTITKHGLCGIKVWLCHR